MLVLQINSVCGYGSTGSIAVDLASVLNKEGHSCHIAYGQSSTTYSPSYKIGGRMENHLHNLCSRLFGNQGYYTHNGTLRLLGYIRKIAPDVIHLHNLHGNYLHIGLLFELLSELDVPVVWTLHDCWAFTGKCTHYTTVGCTKWKTGCYECPLYRAYPPSLFFDRSQQLYEDKKRWFTSLPKMTIVAVSDWLSKEVSMSFLNKYPQEQIYNWIDHTIYYPHPTIRWPHAVIPTDKFVVLSVSGAWTAGSSRYEDAVQLAGMLPDDMQLVLVGNRTAGTHFPPGVIHIPYVNSGEQLAQLYSMADVFVHFSTEDTFGKVIAESMACGTPVVVYNSTACPELLAPGCGYVVQPRRVDDLFLSIQKIRESGKSQFTIPCIENVRSRFGYHTNTHQYLDLYQQVAML
ncbi:hypothetical protein A9168_01765 [Macellibacteroides sp. HH-ZS]|nr:hypothetical protein A9168_01765 [Macellibacteroides sp. HH-ZS]